MGWLLLSSTLELQHTLQFNTSFSAPEIRQFNTPFQSTQKTVSWKHPAVQHKETLVQHIKNPQFNTNNSQFNSKHRAIFLSHWRISVELTVMLNWCFCVELTHLCLTDVFCVELMHSCWTDGFPGLKFSARKWVALVLNWCVEVGGYSLGLTD